MNDILAFADDTLIISQYASEVRRIIDGLTIEIRKIGLELNPLKSQILTNYPNLEETEDYI